MLSDRCPARARALGVIQVLLKCEGKLPLIWEQGKPVFLLYVFSGCTVTAGAFYLGFLDGKQLVCHGYCYLPFHIIRVFKEVT